MANEREPRAVLAERLRSSPPKFVRIVGSVTHAQLEPATNPEDIDHVWISMDVPPFGRVRAAINTISRISRISGFDPRIRVGVVRSTWEENPAPGLEEIEGFSYGTIEASHNVFYEVFEQVALEEFLLQKSKAALVAEVWGDLYARREIGIHQIHCRRASLAVPVDLPNRDGAVKFYFAEKQMSELLLFKFAGQR
jgi:hypothetical protein